MTRRHVASSKVGKSRPRSTGGHAEEPTEGVCVWRYTRAVAVARLTSDEGNPSRRMAVVMATLQAIACLSDVTERDDVHSSTAGRGDS